MIGRIWKPGDILLCINDSNHDVIDGVVSGHHYIISSTRDCCQARIALRKTGIGPWRCGFCDYNYFGPILWNRQRFIKVGESKLGIGILTHEDHSIKGSNPGV